MAVMPTSLATTWERTVTAAPARLALIDGATGLGLTRQELADLAARWASAAPAGFLAHETVAFAEPNGPGWLAIFLGLQKLGAVALPLDTSLPRGQLPASAGSLGAHWLVSAASGWLRLPTDAPPLAGNFCLVKTTSGSSGEPRPLAFTSENMLADGQQICATMEIGPEDRNLGAIPFGHSYGLGNLVLPLLRQGTLVISSLEMLPEALAALVHQFGATVFPSVPAVLRAMAESASLDPARLRTLRRVISAGAPLRPGMAAEFSTRLGLQIQNFYGSSETGGICFDRTGDATLTGRSVGTPLDGVEVRLDEDERVIVRSAAVVSPGEYQLPDLGAWGPHGELVLTGRSLPLANIGGRKVAPGEIERVLRGLPGVSDAWVGVGTRKISGRDEGGGEDFLLAAVETEKKREQIQAWLAEHLPAWQIPRALWVESRLPRNARGKLDRQELERRCREGGG
jgi:acyl-CoA synthetase (AMP-forming)/AMP-acid ligase II